LFIIISGSAIRKYLLIFPAQAIQTHLTMIVTIFRLSHPNAFDYLLHSLDLKRPDMAKCYFQSHY